MKTTIIEHAERWTDQVDGASLRAMREELISKLQRFEVERLEYDLWLSTAENPEGRKTMMQLIDELTEEIDRYKAAIFRIEKRLANFSKKAA